MSNYETGKQALLDEDSSDWDFSGVSDRLGDNDIWIRLIWYSDGSWHTTIYAQECDTPFHWLFLRFIEEHDAMWGDVLDDYIFDVPGWDSLVDYNYTPNDYELDDHETIVVDPANQSSDSE